MDVLLSTFTIRRRTEGHLCDVNFPSDNDLWLKLLLEMSCRRPALLEMTDKCRSHLCLQPEPPPTAQTQIFKTCFSFRNKKIKNWQHWCFKKKSKGHRNGGETSDIKIFLFWINFKVLFQQTCTDLSGRSNKIGNISIFYVNLGYFWN